jgi:hypothetical protein
VGPLLINLKMPFTGTVRIDPVSRVIRLLVFVPNETR